MAQTAARHARRLRPCGWCRGLALPRPSPGGPGDPPRGIENRSFPTGLLLGGPLVVLVRKGGVPYLSAGAILAICSAFCHQFCSIILFLGTLTAAKHHCGTLLVMFYTFSVKIIFSTPLSEGNLKNTDDTSDEGAISFLAPKHYL